MLEHLLFFVNRLKLFFLVDGCQRIHTLRSDFVFWFELLSFAFLRREISDSFSSLKLLFTSSGWTSMLKQGSNSKFGNISPSSSPVLQYEIIYLIHFPWKQHCKQPISRTGLTGSQTVQFRRIFVLVYWGYCTLLCTNRIINVNTTLFEVFYATNNCTVPL